MPSQHQSVDNFDLLHEIGKEGTYHLLYPPPQAGLAILALYQKVKSGAFPQGRFKEAEIYTALENSKYLINADEYNRLPQLKFNSIISDLQVYFLRYDSDEQLYTLKDYADSFCKHAEETLLANFNPTQIEVICNDLRIKLEGCADQDQVSQWIHTFFHAFKPIMKSQVYKLERQIDQSVQEIRATTQLEDTSIIDILKSIDKKLDTLRSQNDELRSAFREMKTINNVLEDRLAIVSDVKIADDISDVRRFFPEIKYTLNLIDKRLDRIQPKLRQFFGMLNKPSFNVKVEKFLKFILAHSTLQNNKKIILPSGVPIFRFRREASNFTIFERREDLFPPTPRLRIKPTENIAEKEKGIASARRHLSMYKQVEDYIGLIIAEATLTEVCFSNWFFKIIDAESGDIELAANVAYALIRKAQQDKILQLEITREKITHVNNINLSLWEMKINYPA